MKRNLLVILIIIFTIMAIGCSKSDKNTSSGPTEVDFSQDWTNLLDIYLMVSSGEIPVIIASKNEVESSELKINDILIDLTDKWHDSMYDEDFASFCSLFADDIPEGINFDDGSELNISLTINSTNYSGNIVIVSMPQATFPEFDVNQDYSTSWTLTENSDIQMFSFECYSYDNEDDDGVYEDLILENSAREYTVSKSKYANYVDNDYVDFYAGIDEINFTDLNKCIFLSWDIASSDSYYKSHSHKKTTHILKSIIENR